MEVIHISGKTETVQKLPESDSPIDMSMFEGWEDLNERQKYYLSVYFRNYPRRTQSVIESGITTHQFRVWMKQDPSFSQIFALIEELHNENLSALHYQEAYSNASIRKDVLKSVGARGYDSNTKTKTTNILNTDQKSLPELLKAING